jgi:hypothetical protein
MNLQVLDHIKIQPTTQAAIRLVECTESEYVDCIIKQGTKLLKRLVVDELQYKVMLSSDAYWTWFINQFTIIDKAILELGEVPDEVEFLQYTYEGVYKWNMFHYWLVMHDSDKMNVRLCKDVIEAAETEWIKAKVKEYAAQ